MRRPTPTLTLCAIMALLLAVGCTDSNTSGADSGEPTGGPVWGGSGDNSWDQNDQTGSNGLPGGSFGGVAEEDDAVRCNVDENCPA